MFLKYNRPNFSGSPVLCMNCTVYLFAYQSVYLIPGFSDSSVGKESACNTGDPGWIPGLVRSAGEGIRYPLQYSWASLVAQLVKNLPATRETWVQSLGCKGLLEKGKATQSSILAWEFHRLSMVSRRVRHD